MARRETFPKSLTELSREALIECALDLQQRLRQIEEQLAEAQAQIAELRRQLFGSKAEKLSPEQQAHLDELGRDLQQEAQQPPPLSQEVLEEERRDQRRRRAERRRPESEVAHEPALQAGGGGGLAGLVGEVRDGVDRLVDPPGAVGEGGEVAVGHLSDPRTWFRAWRERP